MSEAITNTLKFAFGLISDKLRTYGAEKLQGGDLTDQKFRGLLVRELDDIKTKLDGLSRKDLATSISWLKQAVQRLHMAVGEMAESGSQSTSDLPKNGKDGNQPQDGTNAGAYSVQSKPVQQSLTVESALILASAIGKLKIESNELFGLAKQSFNEAGKKACEAFHNASLSTEERILACKVRIASGILEHLDHLEVAASDCLQYLQELHDMPEIQEIFSVHINGGIKAIFKRKSRAEIVQNVTMINLFLSDFISKYTKQRMAVLDWPLIKCGKQMFHPIHFDKMNLPNLKEIKVTPPWSTVVFEDVNILSSSNACVGLSEEGILVCVIGGTNYLDTSKIVMDYYSSETDELQCSCVLHTTNLPNDKYTFYAGCHTNGALALVGTNHVIILQTPSM